MILQEKPFSAACERNKQPILAAIAPLLAERRSVLEIGSGSGQHAVHFAAAMPWLRWQCSEQATALAGLRLWLDEAALPNTPAPCALSIAEGWPQHLPARGYDAVFTANTLHIMSVEQVGLLFAGLAEICTPDARLLIYGPFHLNGQPSSPSNAEFDAELRARSPHMGIRDRQWIDALARAQGFTEACDLSLPANNRLLHWTRRSA